MSKTQQSRRNFLEYLGMTAGATLVSKNALASFTPNAEIRRLNPEQQEFMIRYGAWIDDFIEIVRLYKSEPDNIIYQKKMILKLKHTGRQ